jgi:Enoyl-CoA hydratase/isomerase
MLPLIRSIPSSPRQRCSLQSIALGARVATFPDVGRAVRITRMIWGPDRWFGLPARGPRVDEHHLEWRRKVGEGGAKRGTLAERELSRVVARTGNTWHHDIARQPGPRFLHQSSPGPVARRVTAAPETWFQLPEVLMGLVPGAGGTVSLPRRIPRHITVAMALSGDRIFSETALVWGLADELPPHAHHPRDENG